MAVSRAACSRDAPMHGSKAAHAAVAPANGFGRASKAHGGQRGAHLAVQSAQRHQARQKGWARGETNARPKARNTSPHATWARGQGGRGGHQGAVSGWCHRTLIAASGHILVWYRCGRSHCCTVTAAQCTLCGGALSRAVQPHQRQQGGQPKNLQVRFTGEWAGWVEVQQHAKLARKEAGNHR